MGLPLRDEGTTEPAAGGLEDAARVAGHLRMGMQGFLKMGIVSLKSSLGFRV